ncbi:hypothetical protein NDU88_007682 [Pleurodeles waltl]|uniref:Uncharacterized protein n=1 Tax=Pleurodeles waltl TaxID=8319 RepID=A0AAV7QQK9_PLEWA|nr:hypothetical protein NDU88_007682 [Pleurodeles waltl]
MEDPESRAPEESPGQEPKGSPAEGGQGSAKVSENGATGVEVGRVPTSVAEALEAEDGGPESLERPLQDLSRLVLLTLSRREEEGAAVAAAPLQPAPGASDSGGRTA